MELPGTSCAVNGSSNAECFLITVNGIWKFSQHKRCKILNEQASFYFGGCSAAYHPDGQLFIVSCRGKLGVLQLQDSSFHILHDNLRWMGRFIKCVVIHDELYFFGGAYTNSIWIWNKQHKQLLQNGQMYESQNLANFGLVWDKLSNNLLLFGGYKSDTLGCWSPQNHILQFNTDKHEWKKLYSAILPDDLTYFACTHALKQQFILICGGHLMTNPGSYATDSIYVYNVETQLMNKSNWKCPQPGIYSAVAIHDAFQDQKVIFGYVRTQRRMFLPFDLLDMIQQYYYNEYIYLFDDEGTEFKINTLNII